MEDGGEEGNNVGGVGKEFGILKKTSKREGSENGKGNKTGVHSVHGKQIFQKKICGDETVNI